MQRHLDTVPFLLQLELGILAIGYIEHIAGIMRDLTGSIKHRHDEIVDPSHRTICT